MSSQHGEQHWSACLETRWSMWSLPEGATTATGAVCVSVCVFGFKQVSHLFYSSVAAPGLDQRRKESTFQNTKSEPALKH